jgi:hypothetical protein
MNSLQFAQLWLPFGEFRYPTDDCDIFAAKEGCVVAKMIGVAATAKMTPCQTERREMFVDHILQSRRHRGRIPVPSKFSGALNRFAVHLIKLR